MGGGWASTGSGLRFALVRVHRLKTMPVSKPPATATAVPLHGSTMAAAHLHRTCMPACFVSSLVLAAVCHRVVLIAVWPILHVLPAAGVVLQVAPSL